MKRWFILVAVAAALAFGMRGASSAPADGAPQTFQRGSLEGIREVAVLVEAFDPKGNGERLLGPPANIEALVELRLRKAGIRVVPNQGLAKRDAAGLLYINIHPMERGPLVIASVHSHFQQGVRTEVRPALTILASTWDTGTLAIRPRESVKELIEVACEQADRFANDYLAANGR